MKAKISAIIMVVVVLIGMSEVQAIDVDFYHDAVIDEGDVYGIVSVYDTSPDFTTVDMFGGSLITLRANDSSIVNIYDGEIVGSIESHNSSTVNIYGGILTLDYLAVMDSSTLNVYGGDLLVGNSPGFSESSTVNIYGYDFNYGSNQLTGFLSDGSPFIFNELPFDEYSRMNLIPEPVSVLLLSLGIIFLRKRK